MSLSPSLPLRRPVLVALALAAVVLGAVVAVGTPTAGAVPTANGTQGLPLISLHNDTAEVGADCPAVDGAAWHFVFAPNNGKAEFVTIILKLSTGPGTYEEVYVTGDDIIPNGTQTDNVFVAVPAGHELTDLVALGSYATYTGLAPGGFNLSHVCPGTAPESTTSTTEATPTTETTEVTPTSEVSPTTEVTPTSEVAPTTEVTPTSEATPTTEPAEVLPAVAERETSTTAPATPAADVLGATRTAEPVSTTGTLPYTGAGTTSTVVVALVVLACGVVLAGLARTRIARGTGTR